VCVPACSRLRRIDRGQGDSRVSSCYHHSSSSPPSPFLLYRWELPAGKPYYTTIFLLRAAIKMHIPSGEDRETASITTYQRGRSRGAGVRPAIAGATFCLSFCRMPVLPTIGVPMRIGHCRRGRRRAATVPSVNRGRRVAFGLCFYPDAGSDPCLAAARHPRIVACRCPCLASLFRLAA